MRWVMANFERSIMQEIHSPEMRRNDVAFTYAFGIRDGHEKWGRINREIIKRWSVSALNYIKRRAWRIVEDKCP